MCEIPNIINDENVIVALGQGKTPVSILSDKFCEEQLPGLCMSSTTYTYVHQ